MEVTYSYKVTELVKAPIQGDLTDVVTKASVSVSATAGEETIVWPLINIQMLPADTENFKPFSEITETDVISWLEASYPLGPLKETLAKQLDDIINPKEVVTDLPWVTPSV